jgi:hypothetical protein
MSPIEHGEVYVLDDGGEADLDLGNYERFLETTLTRDHNITTGKVYSQVIARVRAHADRAQRAISPQRNAQRSKVCDFFPPPSFSGIGA